MTTPELTNHEDRLVDDLIGLMDYAGRGLISSSYGSAYQLDKAHALRERVDRLITRIQKEGPLSWQRSEVVQAAVAREVSRYPLGQVLLDAGRLGGTA